MKKLSSLALIMATSTAFIGYNANADTVVGSAAINITGSINGANVCTIAVDGGGLLDVGTVPVSSISSGGDVLGTGFKDFNASVGCTYPSMVAVKFSSSLPNNTTPSDFGIIYTSTNKAAANVYTDTASHVPTAGGASRSYAAIGDQDLATVTSSSTFTPAPTNTIISSIAGNPGNVLTVIDGANHPVSATSFVMPFRVGVFSKATSNGWINDIQGTSLSLNNTMTLELHTL
uniref:Uncharacterized protein n=1 Tax=Edwardsiella tarda TaxID=636 RepID=A0A2S1PMM4_EDWTA|nr:hypothetical protein [Edwardsiella tarda]